MRYGPRQAPERSLVTVASSSNSGAFRIAGARYRYVKALWITGLADRLPMYDTVDEALADDGPGAGNGPGTSKPGEPEATAG